MTRKYSATVRVTNTGKDAAGPISVVFANLPEGVTLANAASSLQGSPYRVIPAFASAANTLAKLQTVSFTVQFSATAPINFTPAVYSGSLQP